MGKKSWGNSILWAIVAINLGIFSPGIYKSYIKLQKLRVEENNIREKIAKTETEITNYKNKINKMEEDFEKEKIARNRLQMIKESEEIYRFINKK